MTALDKDRLSQMGRDEPVFCHECINWLRMNYCMDDDEFFWAGHSRGCRGLSEHAYHRTY